MENDIYITVLFMFFVMFELGSLWFYVIECNADYEFCEFCDMFNRLKGGQSSCQPEALPRIFATANPKISVVCKNSISVCRLYVCICQHTLSISHLIFKYFNAENLGGK